MSESVTATELEDQIALRQQRFKQVINDIRTLLRADIEAFVARETKRAYLDGAAIAKTLTKDRVGALKRRSAQLGSDTAAAIDEALASEALWTSAVGEPENPRELVEAAEVWAEVRAVEPALHGLLDEFGLAPDSPLAYKTPAYFVNGLYLPSLAEHFWRLIHEVSQLRSQKQQLVDDETRADLLARWDEA